MEFQYTSETFSGCDGYSRYRQEVIREVIVTLGTKISGLAVAAAIAAMPVGANAATYISFDGKNGTYGNDEVKKFGFVDYFTFTAPAAGRVWISVKSSFTTPGTNLDLNNFTWVNGTSMNVISTGIDEYRSLLNFNVKAGTQQIRVSGFAQGEDSTYSGTIAFAVPEPATWALLILGFGGVAYSMRRRSGNVKLSYA